MDMDTLTTPQTTTQRSVQENAQMQMRARVGLLRYHSAPSPVLSSFISDEDFFCESIPPQAHTSELAQLLSPVDDMCASVLHLNAMQVECSREATQYAMCPPLTTEPPLLSEAGCFNRFYVNASAIQGARFNKSGHISSICEHIGGNPSADFHASASANMYVDMELKSRKLEFSMPKVAVPISTSSFCQSRLVTTKSNLIRHSSFPADFTCGCAVDGCREGPAPETSGPCIQTRCLESPLSINRSSLFRQGSSPSSFLSQSSFDGTVSGCEKGLLSPSSGSSSEDDRNGKEAQYLCRMSSFWDEAGLGTTAFKQRKRERGTEDEVANGSCVLDSIEKIAAEEETLPWSFDGHMDTSSGGLLRIDDSVLCRARAKRGCATHPRSIAERVRRTKISEGMRKLQELVPNMEKQTNTATMLDEAVEYVKFLQQEVQKLSENQAKCNGMCQSKGST